MKTIVLHPNVARESATILANALKCTAENPFEEDRRDYSRYDLVINYGCNRNIKAKKLINTPKAISVCINKLSTFISLKANGISVPNFTTDKDVAKKYWCVVVRKELDAAGNKGLDYVYPERNKPLPDAPLYTEYFEHKKEFRVVVINGITIAAYEKVLDANGGWDLMERNYQYLSPVKEQCEKAAATIGIDYVGFDVLVASDNSFVILEANSAPVITQESISTFKKYVNKLSKEIDNA